MDQNTPYVILLKIALMWNGYKKFDEGYLCPKTVILIVLKKWGSFHKIWSYFDPINQIHRRKMHVTAAIDGTSDCPGEPWDTSIPRIMVGPFETIGIEGECSTASIEFNPPSCIK